MNKAVSAVQRMNAINPTIPFECIEEKLTTDNALRIMAPFDLVIDATDNFTARYVCFDSIVLFCMRALAVVSAEPTPLLPHHFLIAHLIYQVYHQRCLLYPQQVPGVRLGSGLGGSGHGHRSE